MEESRAPWARINVELSTPSGPLRGEVSVHTGPMRLADLVPSAQELTMVVGGRAAAREAEEGRTITCRAGCGFCCRQLVPISPPAGLMEELPPQRRAALEARFRYVRALLQEKDLLEAVHDVQQLKQEPDEAVRGVNRRYFELRIPCPFLEKESCSIHPDRPVACRDYNVTTPAAWCTDPFSNPVRLVPMPLPLSVALAWLAAERTGSPPVLIPLSLFPFWVEEHQEWGERTWPGLDLFRRFVALAAGEAPQVRPAGSA
jgi:Fe-S-cluster containining protein